MTTHDLPDSVILRFKELLADQTGLLLVPHEHTTARRVIGSRARVLDMDPVDYLGLLACQTTQATGEWDHILRDLTTGESYFFRDQGQIALLQRVLLPRLIEQRRTERRLRLWSAGCSTGEEPYTLILLLDQMGIDWDSWEITCYGSDINIHALNRARQGLYTPWSLRQVTHEMAARYFIQRDEGLWQLADAIRQRVNFQPVNLLRDNLPATTGALHTMDLILCRNVFIYFDPAVIPQVVAKLARTLRPDGILLTGHAEIAGCPLPPGLVVEMFPESATYRKHSSPPPPPPMPAVMPVSSPTPIPPRRPPELPPPATLAPTVTQRLEPARIALLKGDSRRTIDLLLPHITQLPPGGQTTIAGGTRRDTEHADALRLVARAYANLGDLFRAEHYARRALAHQPLAPATLYLLAHIAHERGELVRACAEMQQCLYLDSCFIPAYLDLIVLYEQENNPVQARQTRRRALDALATHPATARLEYCEEWTVAELRHHLTQALRSDPE
jgi:chemotaxis protein methyltransferase CheR